MNLMQKTYIADLKNLKNLTSDIEFFCEQNTLSSTDQFAINLCLDELFTNSSTHGKQSDTETKIELSLHKTADRIYITYKDSSPKFNPLEDSQTPNISSPLEEREVGGLGIFLIKKYMDGLDYKYQDDKNILTMFRTLK